MFDAGGAFVAVTLILAFLIVIRIKAFEFRDVRFPTNVWWAVGTTLPAMLVGVVVVYLIEIETEANTILSLLCGILLFLIPIIDGVTMARFHGPENFSAKQVGQAILLSFLKFIFALLSAGLLLTLLFTGVLLITAWRS